MFSNFIKWKHNIILHCDHIHQILYFQAIRVKVNPLYFMIPATTGCSYAFMLPVSTPPNSIAFASGHLMVKDMVRQLQKHIKIITSEHTDVVFSCKIRRV